MPDRSPDSFLPLHADAFRILTAVSTTELHGYAIVKRLELDPTRSGKIMPANLYRRIRTLLENGLIAEAESRQETGADDERRRYFTLTDLGAAVLRAEADRMRALLASAGDVIGA